MDKTYTVPVTYLQPLVGVFIPILVALVMKSRATSQQKAAANAFLVAAMGSLTTVITNKGALRPSEFVWGILVTGITSWASYNGLWKPSGVTDTVQIKTGNVGLGSDEPANHPVTPEHLWGGDA